jgi:hypothetical protein
VQDMMEYPGGHFAGIIMEREHVTTHPRIGISGRDPEFLAGYSPLFLNYILDSEDVCS